MREAPPAANQRSGVRAPEGRRFGSLMLLAGLPVSCVLSCALMFSACEWVNDAPIAFDYDLLRELPRAEVYQEPREINFGTPSAHPHLVRGFGRDASEEGEPFVESLGSQSYLGADRSTLEFFVAGPRDLELELDFRRGKAAAAGVVEVWLNDQVVGTLRPGRQRRRHRLSLPSDKLVSGANSLEFRPDASVGKLSWFALRFRSPGIPFGTVGASEPPELSEGVEGLEGLEGAKTADSPRSAQARPSVMGAKQDAALRLPFGTRLDYSLIAPVDSVLTLTSLHTEGDSHGLLDVAVATLDGRGSLIATLDPARIAGGEVRLPLLQSGSPSASGARVPLRVSLTARPQPGAGLVGALRLTQPRIVSKSRRRPAPTPNIILYVADTLRRDHLGVYGYPRPVSPILDAFARDAVVFDDALAQSSWTRPSIASLFTGLNPLRHGATNNPWVLSEQAVTLAEAFRSAGYYTAGFTTNPHVSSGFGFAQGFHLYSAAENRRRSKADIHAEHLEWADPHPQQKQVIEEALDWLHRRRDTRPFLLFIHDMAPHAPYAPPDPFWQTFAPEVSRTERVVYENLETLEEGEVDAAMLDKLRALYDAEIAASDTSFGFVLDALMARGLYRDAGIVFVSDHGEEFREHGRLGHGHHLHAETQRIPLLVKPPGSRGGGRRIGEPVSLVDLLPTLLDWAELPSPTEFVAATESRKASELDGVSLAAALQGGGRVDGASEAVFAHLFFGPSAMRTSVTDSRWTLIRTLAPNGRGESLELYDRVADPQNETDVADHHPDAVARLLTLLQREDERTPSWPVPDFEPEPTMLEQLEALGYVQ